ncbi:MAG TPA: alpha/beta hydrolase [Trebonia sp.]
MRGAPRSLAQVVADLRDGLGLGQVDLVGNDAGGAVAQIFAARHPDKVRSFTFTNCDCEGNFLPPEFAPVIEQARQGTADSSFGVKWAYQLRDTIPGASVNEVDGAKIFFPDERPGDLVPHLRKLWGR